MKVNLREIIHYIDESTLEKAKNEKVQKQESPSKMSKDVEESVDKMISNRMSKAYSEWKSNQDTQPFNENIEKEYQKLLETLSPEQEEVLTKYCDEIFASGAETEEFFYREPDDYTLTDDKIEIITQPGTDLWQRTYYHFRNDNAPVLQIETEEKFFSFIVKTDFKESHHRFDQCGVVMYLDSENWLKGSIEYENDNFQHLGSVVTNNGYSDWATTEIDAEIKSMWYRLSRREDDYCIECSEDGIRFKQMRICHMWAGAGKIKFGIYACSPEDSSFKAVFTDMKLTECQWKAHDGQKPDEM